MDGKWREEHKLLKEIAITFAEQLRTGWVNQMRHGTPSMLVTMMRSLKYPMEATYITNIDWEEIMLPVIPIVLQRSCITGTFPRDVFYSPVKYQGLSLMHPWFHQQIMHIITLYKETTARNPTDELLLVNIEQLRFEIGVFGPLTSPLFPCMEPYLTTS
jgi:hypothetical protein